MSDFLKDREDSRFFYNGRVLEVEYDETKQEEKVEQKKREEQIEELDKASQAYLVIAALITTVTFAAGITMPGGFLGGDDHSRPGSAVLRKSAAFKAFIITNSLSLMLSSSAIFIHLLVPFIPSKYFFEKRANFIGMAFVFLLSAMTPMVLAFATGTYAVLAHSNIAIPTCIICLSFFPILVYIFLKFFKV